MLETDAGLRDEKVATCFPFFDLLVHVFPMWDASLGAKDSMNRLVFLNQFVAILSSWPIPGAGNSAHQESVEKQAFLFYCQVFFNYFGRAPTITFFINDLGMSISCSACTRLIYLVSLYCFLVAQCKCFVTVLCSYIYFAWM